jgi:hypothetical protein
MIHDISPSYRYMFFQVLIVFFSVAQANGIDGVLGCRQLNLLYALQTDLFTR